MDPNATLAAIRDAIRTAAERRHDTEESLEVLWDAADSFTDLDEWLKAGGFLPGDWQAKQ